MDARIRDERSGPDANAPGVSERRGSVVTFVLLFLALGLALDGVVGERGWLANRRGRQQVAQAERDLAEAYARNAALRDEAQRLESQDPDTIEDLARREFGFIRPGERVFIVKDVPKDTK
jgi:cell division protein FtsB